MQVRNEYLIDFGVHKGKSFDDVVKDDPRYFRFLVGEDYYCNGKRIKTIDSWETFIHNIINNKQSYIKLLGEEWWNEFIKKDAREQVMMVYMKRNDFEKCGSNLSKLWLYLEKGYVMDQARLFCLSQRLCFLCFKKMPPIGDKRANGVMFDWTSRKFHKKCAKQIINDN